MSGEEQISVLLVDDSPEDREGLRNVLSTDPVFHIVGEAATGEEAVRLVRELRPRLVTMDLVMPRVGGLEAIEEIMATTPTPILVVSGASNLMGMDANFEAISRGALEVIAKPWPWPGSPEEQQSIREVARRLATVPVLTHVRAARRKRVSARAQRRAGHRPAAGVIVIGASTGGPAVLRAILEGLPADFGAPVVIVQHLGEVFAAGFVDWLQNHTPLRVAEAAPGMRLAAGWAVAGIRGPHVEVVLGGGVRLVDEPPAGGHRPAIDLLFESAARAYGARTVGVLLTGMGEDGAAGLKAIANAGGTTVVQDRETCAVFGMPKAAIELGAARHILSPEEIGPFLVDQVEGNGRTSRIGEE